MRIGFVGFILKNKAGNRNLLFNISPFISTSLYKTFILWAVGEPPTTSTRVPARGEVGT